MLDFLGSSAGGTKEPIQMLKNNHTYESEGVTKPQDPTAVESSDHLTFNGLPINTQGFAPLMLLIPHIQS
jgi:hypothetical protein